MRSTIQKYGIIVFLIFTVVSVRAYSQEENYKEVLTAANAGYQHYLEKIPAGQEMHYGFTNRQEFALARIVKPYQVLVPSADFYNDKTLNDKQYLVPSGEWRVSLYVKNECRVMITVAFMNGKWEAVGIGAAALAKELGDYEIRKPSGENYGNLLRVNRLECDFLLRPAASPSTDPEVNLLASSKMVFNETGSSEQAYTLSQILPIIKADLETK